tara:strand:- start:964 stop:1098 length:135 start_codon:yes stop_codon:yes gene_type:complete
VLLVPITAYLSPAFMLPTSSDDDVARALKLTLFICSEIKNYEKA